MEPISTPADLLRRPYTERQFIVVIDDEIDEGLVRATTTTEAAEEDEDRGTWRRVLDAMGDGAGDVVHALGRLRRSGTPPQLVTRTAASILSFPAGHPQPRVVYSGHPVVPPEYYPVAGFHRAVFLHKKAEAIRLLAALGATSTSIHHVRGWSSETEVGASAAGRFGGRLSRRTTATDKTLLRITYDNPSKPYVPDDLTWYPYEPIWREVARGRLEHCLREFSMELHYTEDYGVDAELRDGLGKAGFDMGGHFSRHQETVWLLEGEFAGLN